MSGVLEMPKCSKGKQRGREGEIHEQRQWTGRKAKVILICTRKTYSHHFSSSFQMILHQKNTKGLFSKPGFRDLSNDIADKQPLADSEGAKVIF